jgi:peptidoglycan/LPS O-acetylase OafA/YrhL
MRRINSLDGLRTLAVLLVFVGHVDQRALPGGYIGVEVFFIISGYLITSLLLRENVHTGTIRLRHFYIRRMLRLWPALLLFVVAVTPIAVHDRIGQPLPDGLAALFYVTDFWANIGDHFSLMLHTWSLAVEEQFYLVWPALLTIALRRGWRRRRLGGGLVVVAGVAIVVTYCTTRTSVPMTQFLPNAHVAELVSGVLLALALDRGGELPVALRPLSGEAAALVGLAGLIAFEVAVPARWWAWPLAVLAAWPVVAHLVVHHDGAIARLFARRELVWLGRRSYGFYLWHYAIVELLLRSANPLEAAALGFGLTLVMSSLSYTFWEQPFLRLKDRFAGVRVAEPDDVRAPRAAVKA